MNGPNTKGQTHTKPTGREMWTLPNLRISPPWGRGMGRNHGGGAAPENSPAPNPLPYAAPHTSVPLETPARLLLAPLDTLLSLRGLVQFPPLVLCNPARCSDASSPTHRRDGYLETSAGPLVATLAPAPFFGTCRKPSGPLAANKGFLGYLNMSPVLLETSVFICQCLHPFTHLRPRPPLLF